MVINLNNIIDINMYPTKEGKYSNMRHRPIGIGIQGLADVFLLLETPFDSAIARDLNKAIMETIYYAAMYSSIELAKSTDITKHFLEVILVKDYFNLIYGELPLLCMIGNL